MLFDNLDEDGMYSRVHFGTLLTRTENKVT